MGSHVLRTGLLVGLALLVPFAAADDKKPAGKDDKTKPVSADTLSNGAYTGKILQLPDDDGKFTAQVDITHYEPKDPKHADAYAKAMQQVIREQERVAQLEHEYATAKKPQEQARKFKQLENAQAELDRRMEKAAQDIKVVTEHKTVDFQLSRDAKVRIMVLPTRFDDDGKIKAYTDEEKKALKGDNPSLAGYEAKLGDLKANDAVRIRLWRPIKEKSTDTPSDSEKDGKATNATSKAVVTEIAILNDDKTDKDKAKDSPSKK
jgi:predicted outer membrane protein